MEKITLINEFEESLKPKKVKLELGDKVLEGTLGLGIMLNKTKGVHRVETCIYAEGVSVMDMMAAVEALDDVKAHLMEKIVEVTLLH